MLNHHEMIIFLLSLSLLLFMARALGELARKWHQPVVLGEILAGILLGPTCFGFVFPNLQSQLFPSEGSVPLVLKTFMALAVVMFLFVAGIEVDLSSVWRQGKAALRISFWGLCIPFIVGMLAAKIMLYAGFMNGSIHPLIFMLFMGTAFSISALPVIAKIMMDMNLYRSDIGMVVISSAIVNDLVGWIIFAFILGIIGVNPTHLTHTIIGTAVFIVLMLTVGRWLLDRILPWVQAHTSWPGGFIGFILSTALVCAAITEMLGIHAIFGAFIFGVVLGDSRHLRERTRITVDQFVSFFFAPLFFSSIGLRVNFIENFDLTLVLIMVVLATLSKVAGSAWGARLSGFGQRESLAIGFGMNARGAMEIILGLLALQAGVINEKIFVALVIMALVTSVTSGTLMQLVINRQRKRFFNEFLNPRLYVPRLSGRTSKEVIDELCASIAQDKGLPFDKISKAVGERERLVPTGLENSLAVPHARLKEIRSPIIAFGVSRVGIDFNAPDGQVSKLIFVILTPECDHEIQLSILSDIGKTFNDQEIIDKCLVAGDFTEFLALIKSK